jgi:nucleoside-diphosphate-sugar epimerase
VTGGGGFIGSHLVKTLLQRRYNVRVLDIRRGALEKETSPNLEFMLGSMEDERRVEQATKDVDVIYHLALGYFGETYKSFQVNVKGTLNLLKAARSHKVSQFLFTSSETVYGRHRYLPIDEEHPCNPDESLYLEEKMYPLIKLTTEKLCLIWYRLFGLPVTIFRLTGVYGDIDSDLIKWLRIDTIARKALKGKIIVVRKGEGWEYIHVDDVIQALLLAMLNEKSYGHVFNISNPNAFITDYEIAQFVTKITNSKSKIRQVYDPRVYIGRFSTKKAKRLLGFSPTIGKRFVKEKIRKHIIMNYLFQTKNLRK